MKDILKQIGIGIVMMALFVITILSIILVWGCVVIFSASRWLANYDGFSHNKSKVTTDNKLNKPLDPKLEKQFDEAFSKKPFPKEYSPIENSLYRPTPEELEQLKAKLPPFDREKVFKAVDESNVRMSNKTPGKIVAEVTFNKAKLKGRHNLRGEKGRFIKSPITRYGVPTYERFKNND